MPFERSLLAAIVDAVGCWSTLVRHHHLENSVELVMPTERSVPEYHDVDVFVSQLVTSYSR